MSALAVAAFACALPVAAATIAPAIDGGIRDGAPFGPKDGVADDVIEGSIVQALSVPAFEDRGFVEFRLAGVNAPVTAAWLVLPVFASNGPYPFRIDVFAYGGDGALTLADWDRGSWVGSFLYSGDPTVLVDVTAFVAGAVTAGYVYAGFSLRFAVPSNIALNGPFVAVGSLDFPPPATLVVYGAPMAVAAVPALSDAGLPLLALLCGVIAAGALRRRTRSG